MPDWHSLEAYLHNTAGALFALGAECFGARGGSLDHAASKAAIAYGLTGLMRALPVHAVRGRVDLPADVLRKHGTSLEAVLSGKTDRGLIDLLAEFRDKARGALAEARRDMAAVDERARVAFLPLSLVEPYLAALGKEGRDPLHELADISPLYRLWRIASWR
jgi:phytoene synthase